ncbi:MAG: hypothetical protein Q7R97_02190 [Candidatus Daviesbacteria bacterium]|nr:hypothetical protein [Candidatus Daviesbacteria bacterium]
MQRTQIYLPDDLRKEIDKYLALSGESLAQYLREAAVERLARRKKQKVDLKKLAEDFTSGVRKSGWEDIDVIKWQREIRKDRKII